MRLFAGQKHPQGDWRRARVFYESIPVKGVVIADTDEGWIELVTTDDCGKPLHDGNRFLTHRLYGEIRIDFTDFTTSDLNNAD